EDMAAPRRKIAEHVTHVLVRRYDIDFRERLEQHRFALRRDRLEGEDSRHLERLLIRVNGVERSIEDLDLEVHDWISSEHAAHRRFLNAPVHCGNVLPRNGATDDLIDELVPSTAGRGHNTHPAVAELTPPTGLLFVLPLTLGAGLQCLAIGDLWPSQLCLDAIFPAQLRQ